MRLVIIESPYTGPTPEAVAANVAYARACLLDSLRRSEAPIASHLLYTQVLDDKIPEERALGIEAGLAWRRAFTVLEGTPYMDLLLFGLTTIKRQHPLPVFCIDLGWSPGMLAARDLYGEEGIAYAVRRLDLPTGPIIEGARGLDTPGGTEP